MLTEKTVKHLCKLIRGEEARLVKLATKTDVPEQERNGYIVGISQLASNLQVMITDQQNYKGPFCWRCATILETKDGQDHNGEPVQICCDCGAFVRN